MKTRRIALSATIGIALLLVPLLARWTPAEAAPLTPPPHIELAGELVAHLRGRQRGRGLGVAVQAA